MERLPFQGEGWLVSLEQNPSLGLTVFSGTVLTLCCCIIIVVAELLPLLP